MHMVFYFAAVSAAFAKRNGCTPFIIFHEYDPIELPNQYYSLTDCDWIVPGTFDPDA